MTPPQDSVSDVERLRALSDAATRGEWRAVEHDGSIWIDADDEGDMPVALMMGGSPHNQDCADAAFILAAVAFTRAALAVPIDKIGEDARTYADGVEDAAKLCDAAAGKARFYSTGMGVAANVETGRVREATELATAIRRLSTSTDKGST